MSEKLNVKESEDERYIINEDDLRYKIKIGRYGAYFYDSKLKKDMGLEETRWILNQFEMRINNNDNDEEK